MKTPLLASCRRTLCGAGVLAATLVSGVAIPSLRAQEVPPADLRKTLEEQTRELNVKTQEVQEKSRELQEKLLQKKQYDLQGKDAGSGVKVAFLGVVLGGVDDALASQIGLSEGVGVLVRAVLHDSPAAKAGVRVHDVLHYFNDQLLVNEPQLQTLVRQAGTGAEVKLTLLRKGKSEVVNVKLGEHEERDLLKPAGGGLPYPGKGPAVMKLKPGSLTPATGNANTRSMPALENEIREFRERMQKTKGNAEEMTREIQSFRKRMEELGVKSGPKPNMEPGNPVGVQIHVQGDDENSKGGTVATAISSSTDSEGKTLVVQKNSARTTWTNEKGSGELVVENGSKRLTARDSSGKEIFSGSIDTDEQRARVPAALREQLERIEKSVKIEVRPAESAEGTEKK